MSIVATPYKNFAVMFRVTSEESVSLFAANLLTGDVTSSYLSRKHCRWLGDTIDDLRELMPVEIGGEPAILACAPSAVKSLFSISGLNLGQGPFTVLVALAGNVATVKLGSFQNNGQPEYFIFTLPQTLAGSLLAMPAVSTGVP